MTGKCEELQREWAYVNFNWVSLSEVTPVFIRNLHGTERGLASTPASRTSCGPPYQRLSFLGRFCEWITFGLTDSLCDPTNLLIQDNEYPLMRDCDRALIVCQLCSLEKHSGANKTSATSDILCAQLLAVSCRAGIARTCKCSHATVALTCDSMGTMCMQYRSGSCPPVCSSPVKIDI